MKKFIAIMLVLVTVLGLCACAKPGGTTGGGNYTADGKTKLSIGIIPNAMIMDLKNNALTKWIEKECNVELTFMPFAGGTDVPTQISAAIAARQELPDICIDIDLGASALKRYGDEGYIIDLQDYFADKEGKSKIFWDRITTELNADEQRITINTITDADSGAIYTVPGIETSLADKMESVAWINKEWLDKLNLQHPTNCEELVTVLRAFKTQDPNGNNVADEIPLYSGRGGLGTNIINWLINMHSYFVQARTYHYDENKNFYMSYTTDGYREGLKFAHDLYKEGLLSNLIYSSPEQTIFTPTDGTAICGIMVTHLGQLQQNNELMYQYEPLKTWGHAVRQRLSVYTTNFITESCDEEKRDKAFEVMMKLWSWEGSMRQRYGEYGVNWTDPDEGAVSAYGLPAKYKLIEDALGTRNSTMWRAMCAFNHMAECEDAQVDGMNDYQKKRVEMHAAAYKLFVEAESTNPVETVPPSIVLNSQEKDIITMPETNVTTYYSNAMTDFVTGNNGRNPHNDAHWQEYLNELNNLGLQTVLDTYKSAYLRIYGNQG